MNDKCRYHAFGGALAYQHESHGRDGLFYGARQKTSAGKELSTLASLGGLTAFEPPLNAGFHPRARYRGRPPETTRNFPLKKWGATIRTCRTACRCFIMSLSSRPLSTFSLETVLKPSVRHVTCKLCKTRAVFGYELKALFHAILYWNFLDIFLEI